ncbi:MAG: DUF3006 domain-containing protein [Dehalococcoidia bacterium]|nr:DUF3006 domain-containing protein [Dehalococcoidia bacterium]MDW8120309.1 DUF3006 domain-containing protein [Chloroflexota bacterium]
MKEKAAVDRIEGNLAVLLVGEEEREMVVPLAHLPQALEAGDWLVVEIENGRLVSAQRDPQETQARRQRIQAKLQRLLERSRQERPA